MALLLTINFLLSIPLIIVFIAVCASKLCRVRSFKHNCKLMRKLSSIVPYKNNLLSFHFFLDKNNMALENVCGLISSQNFM